ncbi:MAG: 4Fe-4S dicluster domain-containing protein, partial [Thermoanaerobaculia bacterium]
NQIDLSPRLAAELGLEEGDVVALRHGNLSPKASLELPVRLQPGQPQGMVAVALGYGRTRAGKVADGVGANAFPLAAVRDGFLRGWAAGARLEKTGRRETLAAVQRQSSMEGRPIVRTVTPAELRKGREGEEAQDSLWKEWPREGHHWGMAIDLDACIGCSACVVACQAENNVPVVGREEITRGREMHWIRLDRYYDGPADAPEMVHQPMMCQHCGNAPCETVCPVLATVHSADGLNQQVYNRCVGTRYCENNCPYKVRRFNWFRYAGNPKFDYNMNSDLGRMVLNPDVVVRSRGVMEKCSLCIQRIQAGKLRAEAAGKKLADGAIRTACQQACPAEAITFGDLADPGSAVAKRQASPRFYHELAELNTRPVVGYLARVRNLPEEDKA